MNNTLTISYQASAKMYVSGTLHNIRVDMRRVQLTDTIIDTIRLQRPSGF